MAIITYDSIAGKAIFSNRLWDMKHPCLRALAVAALVCLLSGCERSLSSDFICRLPADEATKLASPEFAAGYFPPSYAENGFACGKSCKPIIGAFESEWYPAVWKTASEGSLYQLSQRPISGLDYTLRFTWLRSSHRPVIILVERKGKTFTMIAKELAGQGENEWGRVQRTLERPLAAISARQFQTVLDSKGLFDQPPATCEIGLDGSEWIFEIADRNGYRMVKRWSPRDGSAHDVGMFLLSQTGW